MKHKRVSKLSNRETWAEVAEAGAEVAGAEVTG